MKRVKFKTASVYVEALVRAVTREGANRCRRVCDCRLSTCEAHVSCVGSV